jgi:hypothetical protein
MPFVAPGDYSLRMDDRPISLVGSSLPSPPTTLEVLLDQSEKRPLPGTIEWAKSGAEGLKPPTSAV